MSHELLLSGLDGSNPLAFLAAMGTLRTLSLAQPGQNVRMSWRQHTGAWRPALHTTALLDETSIIAILGDLMHQQSLTKHPVMQWSVFLGQMEEVSIRERFQAVSSNCSPDKRDAVDFLSAMGCDILGDDGNRPDSKFRAPRTDYFMGNLQAILAAATDEQRPKRNPKGNSRWEPGKKKGTDPSLAVPATSGPYAYLRTTLFQPWNYGNPVAKMSLRIDPIEDCRHALQWAEPTKDPSRKKRGSMLGANRLAVESLPLLQSVPVGDRLITTAFFGRSSRDTFFVWPIWDCPVNPPVCRSLLSHPALISLFRNRMTTYAVPQLKQPESGVFAPHFKDRMTLTRLGVVEIYSSQKITRGKNKNFTPAQTL